MSACPACGYCPHCGRTNNPYPYYTYNTGPYWGSNTQGGWSGTQAIGGQLPGLGGIGQSGLLGSNTQLQMQCSDPQQATDMQYDGDCANAVS